MEWWQGVSQSFTQFWGQLALIFCSRGKCAKAVHATSVPTDSKEIGEDTKQDHLSHNSHKCQKIDAQATEIAMVRLELNKALQENQNLRICSILINW